VREIVARARGESWPRRALWIAVAIVLVGVPVAVNAARSESHRASVVLVPRAVAWYEPIIEPGLYRRLLADNIVLRQEMQKNTGVAFRDYRRNTTITTISGRRLKLTVTADTPARARRIVNALAPQIAEATRRDLAPVVLADIETLAGRIERGRRGTATRRERVRLLRELQRLGPLPPSRVLPGAPAPPPKLERPADRFVDGLPGDLPGRTSPVWAGVVGLLVVLVLWSIGLFHVPPRHRGS
jgi:hypothetical protein